ncbi:MULTISPECIES: chemotaxis protein CheA [Clostridium]|uniref:Chemotaxis protein CheA n=2 Tax=Clostridium TaxID=1485 RepID=D8GKD2_CLOLD|nr:MULTISPECIES: chemotaxis protein CheA [Clostridium]ADK15272.1 predicted chemotaxis protein CheA [Clostridium ljungdahlii DSM 13528]AGY74541.1 chemotaxis protein CheA [Clostridium autoethanogenum DSM 10061]ALU34728.1 CheA signal transduction histidine kinase [Clostridium autoethanogenum DSM 10061]OAA88754.1 Chemotaxis protein CheA [Clostridium ljungdahlii DSM 13528]OVY51447.1 Chemotaxis protein CheA [Clostridium autoethanogenum]
MSDKSSDDVILESYIFETSQLIDQLETLILENESGNCYSEETINEIFRIMHTIKGSSAMMSYEYISKLAHSIEDLFYFLREEKPKDVDYESLSDLILKCVDFIKVELEKIKNGNKVDGNCDSIIEYNKNFLMELQNQKPKENISTENRNEEIKLTNRYEALIFFEDDCEMENLRAYTVVETLREFSEEINYIPKDIMENDDTCKTIHESGFKIFIKSYKSYDELCEILNQAVFLKTFKLEQLEDAEQLQQSTKSNQGINVCDENTKDKSIIQDFINVKVDKLDKLMYLVEEMVIAEAMVTQNSDLKGMKLNNFEKSSRQLHKITSELQDVIMSVRMVPISIVFHKMNRIVHDMSKKLNKQVHLKLIGEDTEVDKNIIEHISDPLMHLVRNSIDHGIESIEDRKCLGKSENGTVTLEAKNEGNDVVVIVKDDGRGLDRKSILEKAISNGILKKNPEEMSDQEIYNLIFIPGFSTNENVTEFSGRGVGMDVVVKNIQNVCGSVSIDSLENSGSTITMKIPRTLAIIDGMNIRVGNSYYTIPITSIKELFSVEKNNVISNMDSGEMIMVRGKCYPLIRIHKLYNIKTDVKNLEDGIIVMVEKDNMGLCIFADELAGQQQVVVKCLPNYIKKVKNIDGLSGCTLLGDGSISLILDIGELVNMLGK